MTKNMQLDLASNQNTPQLKNKHEHVGAIQENRFCN